MATAQKSPRIIDSNIAGYNPLVYPHILMEGPGMTLTEMAKETVMRGRDTIGRILRGEDRRLLVILGPCSTHNPEEHMDYSGRVRELSEEFGDAMVFVQRVYFEKPRTTVGWKGLIYEPFLDGKENINEGLRLARQLLVYNAEHGVLSATEFLDPIVPQYLADTVSWAGIGARTVQSPVHRQMASGLSMPVGFKNDTNGNVQVAVDAVIAARQPQWFLGTTEVLDPDASKKGGKDVYMEAIAVVSTRGNMDTHIVLRGGASGPNYDEKSIDGALYLLRKASLVDRLVVDCSHGNSNKDFRKQSTVFNALVEQITKGRHGIVGIMLESNINEGRQDVEGDPGKLKYGVSITDACIGWEETEGLIRNAYKELAPLIR